MKTIRQLANEIGVSKQAVHQKIKKEPLSTSLHQLTSTVDGVVYIDDHGEVLIMQAFNKWPPTPVDGVDINEPSTTINKSSIADSSLTAVDAQIISILQEQLNVKDKQLYELNARLKETTTALEHTTASLHAAQALHAGTMQAHLLTESVPVNTPPKKSFWQRIFNRTTGSK
jgi:hypothetical protein